MFKISKKCLKNEAYKISKFFLGANSLLKSLSKLNELKLGAWISPVRRVA